MTRRDKMLMGLAVGAAATWGARAWLRSRRSIAVEGRVVVITGASSGHGLILARQAAEQGARLVIAARDRDDLDRAATDLQAAGARDVLAIPTDVADLAACQRLIDGAVARHGRVDILVNNAGIIMVGPVETMTHADFEQAMNVNFWGALHAIEAVLPRMRQQGFGRILNVVSLGGLSAVPHLAPYTASKFALTGLTRALRAELARDNILVTGIYPGTMRTGGHAHAWIKGREATEYALFALSDTLPGLSVSAESVARRAWDAVRHGDAEVRVGWPAHLSPALDALVPNLSAEVVGLLSRLLPGPGAEPGPARQGQDVPGAVAALLTRAAPEPARPRPAGPSSA